MPFETEFATGESLLRLEQSQVFQDFRGRIRPREQGPYSGPDALTVDRRNFQPTRVIAFDGSSVTASLDNGFPMAEASLITVSIVSIDLRKLRDLKDEIPHPAVFYEMESASTHEGVLPGANVERIGVEGDKPSLYFRQAVYDIFNAHLDPEHETLLETVRAMVHGREPDHPPKCPIEGCDRRYEYGVGAYGCSCPESETMYETDAFRFIERFSEVGPNGETHGSVRHALEIVSLMNMLRFFAAKRDRLHYLRDNVFVLDGPLALFGTPAWLAPYVREELVRINNVCLSDGGFSLALFGFEKGGTFAEHFEQIDFCPESGPRARYKTKTVLAPDAKYINRNIVLRPEEAKPHGKDTYFGRKLFYKTASGEHAVVTTGMVNRASQDFLRIDPECFPRLGDILDVLDHLGTYLHRDGFMPLIRAHAHAAIPLTRGTNIIRSLFQDRDSS